MSLSIRPKAGWAAACVCLLCLIILAGCAKSPAAGTARLKVGDVAPNFTLPALLTNDEISMARAFETNVATVVIIWSMACPTCREAMTECQRTYEEYAGKSMTFVGINFDAENINGVRAFLKAEGITFPNAWDPRSRAAKAYRSLDFTFSVFVVDRERQIKLVQYDHPPDLVPLIRRALDKTLEQATEGSAGQR